MRPCWSSQGSSIAGVTYSANVVSVHPIVRVGSSPSRSPNRSSDYPTDKGGKHQHQQQAVRSMKLGGKKGLVNTNSSTLPTSMSSSSPTKDSTGKWEITARGGSDIPPSSSSSSGVLRDDDDNTTGVGSGFGGTRTSTIARRGTSPAPAAVVTQVKVQRPNNNGWAVDDDEIEETDGLLTSTTTSTDSKPSGTASKNKKNESSSNDGWGNDEW